MSVTTAGPRESTAATYSLPWFSQQISHYAVHIVVIGLTVIWMIPTVGLLVSSFRPFSAIASTGWWTAISPPYNFTLQNYSDMLSQSNLGTAIFYSFMVAVPAPFIPVPMAAFAAYAFSWMNFPGRS